PAGAARVTSARNATNATASSRGNFDMGLPGGSGPTNGPFPHLLEGDLPCGRAIHHPWWGPGCNRLVDDEHTGVGVGEQRHRRLRDAEDESALHGAHDDDRTVAAEPVTGHDLDLGD